MAALLVGGVLLGLDKLQQRRVAKQQLAASTATSASAATVQTTRDQYFATSKASEAAKEARRARRRERQERREMGLSTPSDDEASDFEAGSEGEEMGRRIGVGETPREAPPPYVDATQSDGGVRGEVPGYGEHTGDERVGEGYGGGRGVGGGGSGTAAGGSGSGGVRAAEQEGGKKKKKFWKGA